MKLKKLILITCLLIAVISIGTVNASEDTLNETDLQESTDMPEVNQQDEPIESLDNEMTDDFCESSLPSITVNNITRELDDEDFKTFIEVPKEYIYYNGNLSIYFDDTEQYNQYLSDTEIKVYSLKNITQCFGTHNLKVYFINNTAEEILYDGLVKFDYNIHLGEDYVGYDENSAVYYDSFTSYLWVFKTFNGDVYMTYDNKTTKLQYSSYSYISRRFHVFDVKIRPDEYMIGPKSVTFSLTNDENYPDKNFTYNISFIPKINIHEIISNNESDFINIQLPEGFKGNIIIFNTTKTGRSQYNKTNILTTEVINTTCKIPLNFLTFGENVFIINYTGDGEFEGEFHVTLIENNPKFNANLQLNTIELGNDAVLNVIAPKSSYPINIYIDDVSYKSVDLNNGGFSEKISGLSLGEHKIKLIYIDDDGYGNYDEAYSNSLYLTVKEKRIPSNNNTNTNPKTNTVVNNPKVNKITLTLKTIKVKKSAKKLVLQATLKKGKTPLKSKKITFKFNGKKYTVKTNKKGVAKIIIKKSVLKKLKAGNKVKYQATYGKITKKVTVKVKK